MCLNCGVSVEMTVVYCFGECHGVAMVYNCGQSIEMTVVYNCGVSVEMRVCITVECL